MNARERILAALEQSEAARASATPQAPAEAPAVDQVLPVLSGTDEQRVRLTDSDPAPVTAASSEERPPRRFVTVLIVLGVAATAGVGGFLMGGRWLGGANAPVQAAATAVPVAKSAAPPVSSPPATMPAPEPTTEDTNTPFVVSVRSNSEPQPTMPAAPTRVFEPPAARPAAAEKRVAVADPAPPLPQVTGTAAVPKLPMAASAAVPVPPPPVVQQKPAAPAVAIGGKVQLPVLVKRVEPVTPSVARATHTSGRVYLQATIGTNGTVENVRLVSGPVLLAAAAERAVRQWIYQPAMLDGKPVQAETNIRIDFVDGNQ